jgi:hypothetical protein
VNDRYFLLFSVGAACVIHAFALSHGFAVASAVTGDIRPRLRSFIVAGE